MRLCACLGVAMDIIEPCGFRITDKNLKRAGMDYIAHLDFTKHADWEAFRAAHKGRRRVLLTTHGAVPFTDFAFRPDDILLAGRESAGVPPHVHDAADARIVIPMVAAVRSINLAVAAAMALGEALRQTAQYPKKDA